MFSNRWSARAAASHWLSPSVSIPTSRYIYELQTTNHKLRTTNYKPQTTNHKLPILVRVTQRDVPAIGVLVERRRHVRAVDLDHELHGRFHDEVAGLPQHFPEARVQ